MGPERDSRAGPGSAGGGRAPLAASGGGGQIRRAPGAAARGGGWLGCAPARVDAAAAAMQLTVKALQGRECSLQVPEDELVSTLKQLVSEKLNVPVRQQRLLFKGKALAGTQGEETPREPRRKRGPGCSSRLGSRVTGRGAGAQRHFTPGEATACCTAECLIALLPPPEAASRPGPPPRRQGGTH
ncbi:ubiquitin-like protein 4A isoform X2 [Saimiri boliviensis]|uniref:ubiquitin-like protein 4A isoform X2 n=1 Tax=Saimiri boliviensis TaxID=27679 RepID=UPI003D7826CB